MAFAMMLWLWYRTFYCTAISGTAAILWNRFIKNIVYTYNIDGLSLYQITAFKSLQECIYYKKILDDFAMIWPCYFNKQIYAILVPDNIPNRIDVDDIETTLARFEMLSGVDCINIPQNWGPLKLAMAKDTLH